MSKMLFDAFNPVSSKQWKQKIQFDLKGADYNEALVWNSNEGIAVKPFYHSDDFNSWPEPSNTKASNWKIGHVIIVTNLGAAHSKIAETIQKGVESLWLVITAETIDINALLPTIHSEITLHLECQFLSTDWIRNINQDLYKGTICIHTDCISHLAYTGNWHQSLLEDLSVALDISKITKTLTIDATGYQNAGANMVQQLAYALAHANEYLNYLHNDVIARNDMTWQSLKILFKISVGTNYFFEIAKLKALRILWSALAKEYKLNTDCKIVALPSKRNKTIYDYNTNMLRTTTECMSAIIGGADTVCNVPYDVVYHKANEFADRIAINQLLILKHESYFDKVDNPSDGAYYIETLTDQLSEKALLLFKDIEANGGFLKQLKAGTIQRKIKESASKEQAQFNDGTEVLLGTNKYPNPNDRMNEAIEKPITFQKSSRKTLIEPIIEKRLAQIVEYTRLKSES